MSGNYLWDKQSPNPMLDVENPSVPINTIASAISSSSASTGNTRNEGSSRSMRKTTKLGFVLVALSVAVVLAVTLSLRHSSSLGYSGETESVSASVVAPSSHISESSVENTLPKEADNTPTEQSPIETKPDDLNSIKPEYYTSVGPLEARVKMVSSSIVNGYESCSDLESDITEALKLYMNNFIMNEALLGEVYANCDPENANWGWDLHVYGDDYHFGEAASAVKNKKSTATQSRSHTPSASMDRDTGHSDLGSKKGDKTGDNHGLNNQNDSANEHDRVVSDGTYVYAAYGDVLHVWAANDTSLGVSTTKMPGNEAKCDWSVTEPCIATSKPTIKALFVGNARLAAVVSQSSSIYAIENKSQPVIPDDTKTYVLIFDTSIVSLGSPLEQIGYSELTGRYFNGRSIGDKTILATESHIDALVLTQDLSRFQPQYCGLDAPSYEALAAEIATANAQSFAKQVVAGLGLVNDCSRIFQVSMFPSSGDESDANIADMNRANILERFVQVSAFDMTSDVGKDGEISIAVAGAFTPGVGWPVYLADDFLAVPSNSKDYSYTSIHGFDLSTEAGAVPFCYGLVPGNVDNNYRMDMWDGHLRVTTTNYFDIGSVELTSTSVPKIYILEVPSIEGGSGEMSLVGEADISGGIISGTRFVEDKAYAFTTDLTGYNEQFLSLDLSDHLNPQVTGNLAIDVTLSYLQEIIIDSTAYILGIGHAFDDDSWLPHMVLLLFDISTPSSLKLTASYRGAGGSYSDATGDFLAVRYLPESKRLIIPVLKNDGSQDYNDGFTVFDVSKDSITPAFNVTHSTIDSYCSYEASIPARSFVFQSELTTIKGHTVISTEMQSGNSISELDLDVDLNYSVCEPLLYEGYYYYESYEYDYNDEAEGAVDGTQSCNLTDSVQADIVDICTDTEFASRSWVFHRTSMSLCNNWAYFEESMGIVSSADECAQKCVEKYDGQDGVRFPHYPVRGFQYVCDGNCVCLVDSDDVTDLNVNTSVASGCYGYAFPMGAAAIDPDGLDDAYGC